MALGQPDRSNNRRLEKVPYKRGVIPSVLEDGKILLSELCHDEIIANPWGDRHVHVLLGDRVIFDGWLGEERTKAFGFSEYKYYSRVTNRFSRLAGTDLTWRLLYKHISILFSQAILCQDEPARGPFFLRLNIFTTPAINSTMPMATALR
jgi:hypothetical protein